MKDSDFPTNRMFVCALFLFAIGMVVWGFWPGPYVDRDAPVIVQAAQRGDLSAIRRTLARDPASLRVKDSKGNSAAHWAILHNKPEIATYIAEHGYPINPENEADFPLIMCCLCNCTPESDWLLEYLVAHGADVNVRYVKEGWTPLGMAVNNGMESKVRILAEAGADLNSKDRTGLTPMEMAKERLARFKNPRYNLPHGELSDPRKRQEAVARWQHMVDLLAKLQTRA